MTLTTSPYDPIEFVDEDDEVLTSAHPAATEGNVLWRNPPIDRLAWRAKELADSLRLSS